MSDKSDQHAAPSAIDRAAEGVLQRQLNEDTPDELKLWAMADFQLLEVFRARSEKGDEADHIRAEIERRGLRD